MFLARTVEHTTDWRSMLHRMEPREFKEWLAMYSIEPWGVELPTEKKPEGGGSLGVFKGMAGFA